MIIEPTCGRVVWYRPKVSGENELVCYDLSNPFDAHVVYVHGSRLVNLVVFDHDGNLHKRRSIVLLQEGDEVPVNGYYAEWMPYQVGQAKKHA